ncbi:hypothetical protein A1OQ_11620 [Enterovibrio norvegicus FF-162]|uniref:hypothetical protein n=1 Tax=Enterovibrio norvegicus TaxID=188144 RepID=UPI00035C514F|nr:hypothetical protein [Enterovibrio norvegicus]OEE89421.1 hypothetical protein A1OQ_11620 [Enterovibrio norvegicus FF-162]
MEVGIYRRSSRRDVQVRSETINRWVGRLQNEFAIKANGTTPTERMESVIKQLADSLIENPKQADKIINELIESAFDTGVQEGFKKALDRVQDGKIKVRKARDKEQWILTTESRQYQITEKIPSIGNVEDQNSTAYISLAEHGFSRD